jgi:hypothetical protein
MRYWVNSVPRQKQESVPAGDDRLKRTSPGDRVVFYAPKKDKRFTAIAEVGGGGHVSFVQATEAPIQPLIEDLEFIPNKQRWGFPFRRGFFEIGEADYRRIARAMNAV